VPPAGVGALQVGGPVGELDPGAAVGDRAPDRGARLAVVGELVPDVVGGRTSAVSPPCGYSSELAAFGSTQPVPVVVMAARISRWKAPVRSSSWTASAARWSGEPADRRPA